MEIMVVLLEFKECGFGVTDIRGRTALMCAVKSGHKGVVKMRLYGTMLAPHRGYQIWPNNPHVGCCGWHESYKDTVGTEGC